MLYGTAFEIQKLCQRCQQVACVLPTCEYKINTPTAFGMAGDPSVRNYSRLSTSKTSHQRTFFDVRSRQSIPGRDNPDDDEDAGHEALTKLVKMTWNVSAVSPLFGLDVQDEVKLKRCAKRLRESVASTLTKEDVSYEARFTPLENLVCHPSDPPALQVEVHSTTDGDDKVTRIYLGIFLSWGKRRNLDTQWVALPILLSRGLQGAMQAVHSTICQMFDCLITPLPASQEDLTWLTAIVLNSAEEPARKKSKEKAPKLLVDLEYHVPGLPASDRINVKLPLSTCADLWLTICSAHQTSADLDEQPASVIKLEHVKRFFESVRDLMLENAMLELGNCLLTTISLPSLTIKANKMKVTDIDTMDRILWFFQEKALIYSPILNLPPCDAEME